MSTKRASYLSRTFSFVVVILNLIQDLYLKNVGFRIRSGMTVVLTLMGPSKKFLIKFSTVAIVASVLLSVAGISSAQESSVLKLELSPPVVDLRTTPSQAATADIKVKNSGTGTETLKVGIQKMMASGETGQPQFENFGEDEDVSGWVSFSKKMITLLPNEEQTVTVTVRPPASAHSGYYFAVTFFRSSVNDTTFEGAGASLTGGAATLFLLNVESDGTQRSMEIVAFEASKRFYEFLPAEFTVRVKNTGNTHIAPRGSVFVDNGAKMDVGTVKINKAEGNVLPDSIRAFTLKWDDGFPNFVDQKNGDNPVIGKDGKPKQRLSWDLSKLPNVRFGKYTGRMVFVYNDGVRDVPLEAFVSFWVFPWRFALTALVIALFVLLGLRSILLPVFQRLKRPRIRR